MKSISELHNAAMDLAEQAARADAAGKSKKALGLLRRAFVLERTAAEQVASKSDSEPSRSILLRSAASLALDCKEMREAERLIAIGLSGNPPEELCEEFRDLLEAVHFERHLKLRGIALQRGELQMSLVGDAIGLGLADSVQFLKRADTIEKLLVRTAERKREFPFRRAGSPPVKDFEIYFSTPVAASFAIAVRFGRPERQLLLPSIASAEEIVEECLDCFEMFNSGEREQLAERIPDEDYFNNFVALARKLAPDGERVKTVGFTSISGRKERHVAMNQQPGPQWVTSRMETIESIEELTGWLRAADELSMHRYDMLQIESLTYPSNVTRIIVAPGMLQDIVKPLWGAPVKVVVEKSGQTNLLISIDQLPPDQLPVIEPVPG